MRRRLFYLAIVLVGVVLAVVFPHLSPLRGVYSLRNPASIGLVEHTYTRNGTVAATTITTLGFRSNGSNATKMVRITAHGTIDSRIVYDVESGTARLIDRRLSFRKTTPIGKNRYRMSTYQATSCQGFRAGESYVGVSEKYGLRLETFSVDPVFPNGGTKSYRKSVARAPGYGCAVLERETYRSVDGEEEYLASKIEITSFVLGTDETLFDAAEDLEEVQDAREVRRRLEQERMLQ